MCIAKPLKSKDVRAPRFALNADDDEFYEIDTGAGLVFKIRRIDEGVSTQSVGDLASLVYNGVEYLDRTRGSQINAGFDWLYSDMSDVSVEAVQVDSEHIKVTVTAAGGKLTHYYLAKNGDPRIYMATIFDSQPDVHAQVRYIVRTLSSTLPNGPQPSDVRGNTGAIESGDIFGMENGETRSKHYFNPRTKDWSYIGATGDNVGLWMVRGNSEGMAGGPFYRCHLNQCGSDQEITYILMYGMAQTESFRRTNILNLYTLVATDGDEPPEVDTSWLADMGLEGWVSASGRGSVAGSGITGMDATYPYTVGFSNTTAQYWADADSDNGSFTCTDMLPGDYTVTVFKNELAVATSSLTIVASETTRLDTIDITDDPSADEALWRIGDWDGTPSEFLNGDQITWMHPSDVRMSAWAPGDYIVGTSEPGTGFPAYQWKEINDNQIVRFNLSADQIASYRLRIGITVGYIGGRPNVQVNGWTSNLSTNESQPGTRSLTVGTYRGNNTTYPFTVPASALVEGENVLTISVISGSSGSNWLNPGFSYDAVDFIQIE